MFWIIVALGLGGLLKGATGAGSPIIGIPVLAIIYDVPFAITVYLVPNLLSNLWQAWHYRRDILPAAFTLRFAGAGVVGAAIGTAMLANLPSEALMALVALAVFAYIAFRLSRPDWVLPYPVAFRVAIPAGLLAGILQGAAGVSAPASITFLNAMKPTRAAFVATISVFFVGMSLAQIPMLWSFGFLSWTRVGLSCAALVPLLAMMPVGAALARRVSKEAFDRVILVLLAAVALRLLAEAVL